MQLDALRALGRRWGEVVLCSAIAGAITGLGVSLFERIVVDWMYDRLVELSPWLLAWMPLCGLVLAAVALRFVGRTDSPATTDDYLQAFHDPMGHPMQPRA